MTVRLYEPSLPHCDDMPQLMPSTPLTCCSIGAATVSATTTALAGIRARHLHRRRRVGGYCAWAAQGRDRPRHVMMIDSTEAKDGPVDEEAETMGRMTNVTMTNDERHEFDGSGTEVEW